MSEQSWIFIFGIIAAVSAYLMKSFVLEPLLQYRKVKGKIQNRLIYHADVIVNSGFTVDQLQPIWEELRQLSCDLSEAYAAIPFTRQVWWLLRIPSSKAANEAARSLIALSNGAGAEAHVRYNEKSVSIVKKILKINSTY